MVAAMFLFAGGDALSKLLTNSTHPVQIIWFRQLGLLFGAFYLLGTRGKKLFHSKRPGLQITRGTLAIFSGLLFVFAVKHVPLADAIAASFVAPFFVTMLSSWVLSEKVQVRQWVAVTIGFIGAAIVVRPGFGSLHPAIMLVVGAAFFFAARQVIGRLLADTDSTATTIVYTALTASLLISLPLPFVWTWPATVQQWSFLLGMAALAGCGEVLIVKSLEVANAAVVAPMHYSIIIWGTIYGFLIFDQLPDQWTSIGAAIIIVAGLYTVRVSRQQQS